MQFQFRSISAQGDDIKVAVSRARRRLLTTKGFDGGRVLLNQVKVGLVPAVPAGLPLGGPYAPRRRFAQHDREASAGRLVDEVGDVVGGRGTMPAWVCLQATIASRGRTCFCRRC